MRGGEYTLRVDLTKEEILALIENSAVRVDWDGVIRTSAIHKSALLKLKEALKEDNKDEVGRN